jgi:hypothetical protein
VRKEIFMHVSRTPIALTLGLALLGGAAEAELISNGGFETGDLSGFSSSLFGSSGVTAFPRSGAFSLTLTAGSAGVPNQIAQPVALTPGGQYHLELWVYNAGVGEDGLRVTVDGQTAYDLSPTDFSIEAWNYLAFDFTADASAGNDEFVLAGWDTAAWLSVDDISLTAVPTPGAALLLGAAGLLNSRRRR